jgi:peptide/nickel transport system permease protein
MTGYIIRRLLLMFPLLLGVSIITFLIIQAAPGDPVSLMLAESSRSASDLR